jgi:hypothetical protein
MHQIVPCSERAFFAANTVLETGKPISLLGNCSMADFKLKHVGIGRSE